MRRSVGRALSKLPNRARSLWQKARQQASDVLTEDPRPEKRRLRRGFAVLLAILIYVAGSLAPIPIQTVAHEIAPSVFPDPRDSRTVRFELQDFTAVRHRGHFECSADGIVAPMDRTGACNLALPQSDRSRMLDVKAYTLNALSPQPDRDVAVLLTRIVVDRSWDRTTVLVKRNMPHADTPSSGVIPVEWTSGAWKASVAVFNPGLVERGVRLTCVMDFGGRPLSVEEALPAATGSVMTCGSGPGPNYPKSFEWFLYTKFDAWELTDHGAGRTP